MQDNDADPPQPIIVIPEFNIEIDDEDGDFEGNPDNEAVPAIYSQPAPAIETMYTPNADGEAEPISMNADLAILNERVDTTRRPDQPFTISRRASVLGPIVKEDEVKVPDAATIMSAIAAVEKSHRKRLSEAIEIPESLRAAAAEIERSKESQKKSLETQFAIPTNMTDLAKFELHRVSSMNVSDARAIRASQNLHTDSFSKPEGRALSTAEMYPANQNISGTVYSSEEVVGKNYVERGAQMYVTFDAYRFITNRILNMNAYSINTLENYYNILLEKRNMDDLQRRERVVRRLSGLERRANELSVECKKLFEARCALEKEMVGVQKKWETTIQILRELMLMNTHLAELKVQYKPERIRGSQYLGSHASMYSGSNMNLGKGTSSQSQLEGFGSTGAALSRRKKESDSPSSHAGGLASGFNISGSRQGSYSHSRQNSVQYSRPSSRQGSRVGSRRQSIIGELDNIQEQASRANLKG